MPVLSMSSLYLKSGSKWRSSKVTMLLLASYLLIFTVVTSFVTSQPVTNLSPSNKLRTAKRESSVVENNAADVRSSQQGQLLHMSPLILPPTFTPRLNQLRRLLAQQQLDIETVAEAKVVERIPVKETPSHESANDPNGDDDGLFLMTMRSKNKENEEQMTTNPILKGKIKDENEIGGEVGGELEKEMVRDKNKVMVTDEVKISSGENLNPSFSTQNADQLNKKSGNNLWHTPSRFHEDGEDDFDEGNNDQLTSRSSGIITAKIQNDINKVNNTKGNLNNKSQGIMSTFPSKGMTVPEILQERHRNANAVNNHANLLQESTTTGRVDNSENGVTTTSKIHTTTNKNNSGNNPVTSREHDDDEEEDEVDANGNDNNAESADEHDEKFFDRSSRGNRESRLVTKMDNISLSYLSSLQSSLFSPVDKNKGDDNKGRRGRESNGEYHPDYYYDSASTYNDYDGTNPPPVSSPLLMNKWIKSLVELSQCRANCLNHHHHQPAAGGFFSVDSVGLITPYENVSKSESDPDYSLYQQQQSQSRPLSSSFSANSNSAPSDIKKDVTHPQTHFSVDDRDIDDDEMSNRGRKLGRDIDESLSKATLPSSSATISVENGSGEEERNNLVANDVSQASLDPLILPESITFPFDGAEPKITIKSERILVNTTRASAAATPQDKISLGNTQSNNNNNFHKGKGQRPKSLSKNSDSNIEQVLVSPITIRDNNGDGQNEHSSPSVNGQQPTSSVASKVDEDANNSVWDEDDDEATDQDESLFVRYHSHHHLHKQHHPQSPPISLGEARTSQPEAGFDHQHQKNIKGSMKTASLSLLSPSGNGIRYPNFFPLNSFYQSLYALSQNALQVSSRYPSVITINGGLSNKSSTSSNDNLAPLLLNDFGGSSNRSGYLYGNGGESGSAIGGKLYTLFVILVISFVIFLFIVAIVGFCVLTSSIKENYKYFVPKKVRVWTTVGQFLKGSHNQSSSSASSSPFVGGGSNNNSRSKDSGEGSFYPRRLHEDPDYEFDDNDDYDPDEDDDEEVTSVADTDEEDDCDCNSDDGRGGPRNTFSLNERSSSILLCSPLIPLPPTSSTSETYNLIKIGEAEEIRVTLEAPPPQHQESRAGESKGGNGSCDNNNPYYHSIPAGNKSMLTVGSSSSTSSTLSSATNSQTCASTAIASFQENFYLSPSSPPLPPHHNQHQHSHNNHPKKKTAHGIHPWVANPARKVTRNHQPKLNDPCDFVLYSDYFEGVRKCGPPTSSSGLKWYDCSTGDVDKQHPLATLGDKYMDPKFMCIKTDNDYNLDMNEFDCMKDKTDHQQINGYYGCGSRCSQIDFNDPDAMKPRLNTTTYSYEYTHFPSLHKGLIMQETAGGTFECVASHFNHCTLKENKKAGRHITECASGLVCLNISVTHPMERFPFFNSRTGEWYGICLHPYAEGRNENPFSFAWRKENGFSGVLVIFCIIWQFLCN